MSVLFIDFETRGVLDLREVGLHNYARHPQTDVWCMAHAQEENDPSVWLPAQKLSSYFVQYIERGGLVIAHNAPFELEIWNEIMVPRYGWPVLKPEQVICTMAAAYAMALPGALEDVALALGLNVLKDTEGRSLMLRMARPRSIERGKPIWWDDPDKLARLYAYCQQDVRVEREVYKRLMPLSDKERKLWQIDYAINQRGVKVDMPAVKAGIKMAEFLKADYDRQITEATNGEVQTCNALIPLKQWLKAHGCAADSLTKQDVVDLLANPATDAEARTVLTLRQDAGKASTAKLASMLAVAGEDDRLRNLFQYHGAATGRWAGRKVQPHNLRRDTLSERQINAVFDLMGKNDV